MVRIILIDNFNHNVLEWDGDSVPMNKLLCQALVLVQTNNTTYDIQDVVIQTTEPVLPKESTERIFKIL